MSAPEMGLWIKLNHVLKVLEANTCTTIRPEKVDAAVNG